MSITDNYLFLGSAVGGSLCQIGWITGGPKLGACQVLTLGAGEGAYLYEESNTTYLYSSILHDCSADLCRYQVLSSSSLTKVNDISVYGKSAAKSTAVMPDGLTVAGVNERSVKGHFSTVLMGVSWEGYHYLSTLTGSVLRCHGPSCEIFDGAHASPAMWRRTIAVDDGQLYTTSPLGREHWDLTGGAPVLVSVPRDSSHGSIAAGDGVLWEGADSWDVAQLYVDNVEVDWAQEGLLYWVNFGADVYNGQLVLAAYSTLLLYELDGCGVLFEDGFESGDTSFWG
jgi:hypothetical protein